MSMARAGTLMTASLALLCMLNIGAVFAQQPGTLRVEDRALGISFAPVGAVAKSADATYVMTILQSPGSPGTSSVAEVSAGDRPYVDLPGSFGGKLYLDSPPAQRILGSRILVDSLASSGLEFRREYWTVYAGMGMWEGVIDCYARAAGRYYTVSLVQEAPLGKPGEDVDGKPLAAEEIRARLLASLRDSTGDVVSRFGQLLSSLQITGR